MQIRQCGAILAEKRSCLPHLRRHSYHRLTEDGSSFHCALGSSALSILLPAPDIFLSPPSPPPLPLLLLSNLVSFVSTFVSPVIHCFSLICIYLCCIRLSHQSTHCPHYANSANLDFAHNAGLCVFGGLDGQRRCAARKCSS